MDKDIISVKMEDGSSKDMEIVYLYSDNNNQKYIVYKNIDDKDKTLYGAKYDEQGNLDTNLSKKELASLEIILNNMLESQK